MVFSKSQIFRNYYTKEEDILRDWKARIMITKIEEYAKEKLVKYSIIKTN